MTPESDDDLSRSDPPAAAVLRYQSPSAHPLSSVIRAIGVTCLLLVAVRLVLLVSALIEGNSQIRVVIPAAHTAYLAVYIAGFALDIALIAIQAIAGVLAFHTAANSLRWLKFWAVASLAITAAAVAVSIYLPLHFYSSMITPNKAVHLVAYNLDHLVVGLSVPIFVLCVLRAPAFADAIGKQDWA